MEHTRLSAADRVVVANRYVVRISPADLRGFGDLAPSLELELADAALKFARAHRYTLADRPAVRLVADARVSEGDASVDASFWNDVASLPSPGDEGEAAVPGHAAVPGPGAAPGPAEPAVIGPGIRSAGHPRGRSAVPAIAGIDPKGTLTFKVPVVDSPAAVLREVGTSGNRRQLTLNGAPVTIGRATDNSFVVQDSRVSRHHGRLQARSGALIYRDLGSTNGSRVNGVLVDEVVLGVGDRIELGDTVLVVESAPGD